MSLPNALTPSTTFDSSIVAAGRSLGIGDSLALPQNEVGARPAEALQLEVEEPEFDLGRELERVVDLLATRADAKGIELASFVDPEVPARLCGAAQRFQQVAANLLGHAVQATERGGVLVRVSLGRETSWDANVLVSIWYTGHTDGNAGERPGHAFPALRRLVELLGGDLGWGASAGGGSVLWFTARFTKPPSVPAPFESHGRWSEPTREERRAPQPQSKSRRARVLVAEGDAVDQRITLLQLSRLGYVADGVANDAEAVAALNRTRYDLVLVDVGTLDLNGPSIALIRGRDVADRRTPIVAMAASQSKDERERLARAGMDDYLGKPVKSEELQLVLSRLDIGPVCHERPECGPRAIEGRVAEGQAHEAQPNKGQSDSEQGIESRTTGVQAGRTRTTAPSQDRPPAGTTAGRWSRAMVRDGRRDRSIARSA